MALSTQKKGKTAKKTTRGLRNLPNHRREAYLGLEHLEARIIPAVYTWTGAVNSNFNTAGNWSPGAVPGAGDDIILNISSTITSSVNNTVRSITQSSGTLHVDAGTTFTISGGATSTWSGGTWNGGGQLTLDASASVNISGAVAKVVDTITVNQVAGSTVTWTGTGNLQSGNSAIWNNSGNFTIATDADFTYDFGLIATFNNLASGTVSKNAGGGTDAANFNIVFNNQGGTITVNSGLLTLDGGASTGGTFNVAASSILDLTDGDTQTLTGTYTGSGSGTIHSSGTIQIGITGATFNFPSSLLQMTSGSITGLVNTAVLTNTGTINFSGASSRNVGGIVFNNNGTVNWTGTGNIQTGNALEWNNVGTLNIQADADLTHNFGTVTTLTNTGSITKTAGTDVSIIDVILNNSSGGTVSATTGTLSIDGTGTSNGTFSSTTGVVAFTYNYTFATGTTITGVGKTKLASGTMTMNAAVIAQNLEWQASILTGPGSLTVTNALDLTGNSVHDLNGTTLINQGTANWLGNGNIQSGNTAAFQNQGSFVIQTDADFTFSYGGIPTLINTGTITKTSPINIGTTSIGALLNNYGNVVVTSGELQLAGGGTSTGSYAVAAVHKLNFTANTHTLNSGATISGAGTTIISGGTVNFEGTIPASNLMVSGGTLGGTGTITAANSFTWTSGSLSGTGTTVVQPGATLNFSGANSRTLNARTLVNQGTGNWTGTGNLESGNGAIFNNQGTLSIQTDADFSQNFGAASTFNNSGTLIKTSPVSTGVTGIGVIFNNTGSTNVVTGDLQLGNGGTSTGQFSTAEGHRLQFTGGTHVLNTGAIFTGNGSTEVTGGTLTVNTTVNATNFSLSGGYQSGTGTLNISEEFIWGAGELSGSGTTRVLPDALLSIVGPNNRQFNGRTLVNEGAGTWSGLGQIFSGNGAVFNNQGTLTIQNDTNFGQNFGAATIINNSGTWSKSGGTGTSSIGVIFNNTGVVEAHAGTLAFTNSVTQLVGTTLTGNWEVYANSTLDLPGSNVVVTNSGSINLSGSNSLMPDLGGFSTNLGTLRVEAGRVFATTGALANSGTVIVGPASQLTVNGAYTQNAPNGRLIVEIGGEPASGQFGKLVITGAATLNGFVEVQLVNGFGPTQGGNYSVMTYASESGVFSFVSPTTVIQGSGQVNVFGPSVQPTEFLIQSLTNAADLETTSITGLNPAVAGQPISIGYQVRNNASSATSITQWQDSVYLSLDSVLDESDTLLGRVTHNGVVAGGGIYNEILNTTLPGVKPGQYRVIVVSDSRNFVPDTVRSNNKLVSSSLMTVDMTPITPGTPVNGTIDNNQDLFYRVTLTGAQAVRIRLTGGTTTGLSEVYVRYQEVGNRTNYDHATFQPGSTSQELILPGTQAGTYYLQLHGREGATGGKAFTLSVDVLAFQILTVKNNHGSNLGNATVTLQGSGFTPSTTAKLKLGATERAASSLIYKDSSTLWATFDLTGLPANTYDIVINDPTNGSSTSIAAFTVNNLPAGQLKFNLSAPTITRALQNTTVTIDYENTGETDIVAPYFNLIADWAIMRLPEQDDFVGSSIQFLGINPDGPAGILPAGFKGTITLPAQSISNSAHVGIHYDLQIITNPTAPINWNAAKAGMKPASISSDAWEAIFANFVSQVGSTASAYQQSLANMATYLSTIGATTYDVQRLIQLEYLKANADLSAGSLATSVDASMPSPGMSLTFSRIYNATLAGRYAISRLGRGWTDNWNIYATTDGAGNATIHNNGIAVYYHRNTDGSYEGNPGNFSTLTQVAGEFQLRYPDGSLLAFRPDGKFDHMEDTNGNRITAGYDGSGRLTTLSHTSGASLTITYNPQSQISSVTDSSGRVSTYTYTGEYLTSYTDKFGTTSYSYITGQGIGREHALSEIAFSNNTHVYFNYDAQGRLIDQHGDSIGGVPQDQFTFSYGNGANFSVTDAAGGTMQQFFDDKGNSRRVIDPRGFLSQYVYCDCGSLRKTILPDGSTYSYDYDTRGNLTKSTDPLGNSTIYTYSSTNVLTSFTDGRGNATTYQYDTRDNLIRKNYADGAFEQFSYDTAGNLTSWTNARGQTLTYVYNNLGLVTSKTYADNSVTTFTYDSTGMRLLSATDSTGSYSFTYNTLDAIATYADPYGHTLAFTYNTLGQTLTSVDQLGFTVNYVYDPVGRLDQLRDGSNALIIDYTYDAASRLIREDMGNGTFTTYLYDLASNLTNITHQKNAVTVNSSYDYTYDSMGRVASMTTAGVTTNYGYDLAGQLTSVVLPGRSIQYVYDAAGNRVSVTDNSVTTNYVADNRNRYLSAGSTTFTYDTDSNLISKTTAGVTTNFSFNQENQITGMATPSASDSWTYQIDPFGQRVATTHNTLLTRYVVDPIGLGNILGEYTAANALVAHYTHGFGLVSRSDASNVSAYYDADPGPTRQSPRELLAGG